MNGSARVRFAVKPVVAALAVAFAAGGAYADPTPTQLPGAGLIRAVNTGTTLSSPGAFWLINGGGAAGGEVYNGSLNFPGTLQLNNAGTVARAVIRWGGNTGSSETYNPAGFNIGANATMFVTSSGTVTSAALLNIDASGNPSQIFGRLISTANIISGSGGGAAPAIFVANASGVIVGSAGEIHGPNGVGLIGANLNGGSSVGTAEWEFVANNGAGVSFVDVTSGQSTVDVRGFIYGGTVGINTNTPAKYVLLVGGDVMNTGNVFGNDVTILPGMRSVTSASASDTVNGISKVPVQRLFNVDTGMMKANLGICTLSASCLEVAKSGSTLVNDGSISSKSGTITIVAAKGIRTGTKGNPDPLTGMFSDSGIFTDVVDATGNTELYGVIRGYTTGVMLSTLYVNQHGGNGDVTLQALTVGSQPSSITTTGPVFISGQNVHIDSTINHTLTAINAGWQLGVLSLNSLTTTAAMGAGDDVFIVNSGAGGINIGADVFANRDGNPTGALNITNSAAGSPTTITGGLFASGSTTGNINVSVNGPLSIVGSIVSDYWDVNITNNQNGASTSIMTTISAGQDINIMASGPLHVDTSSATADRNINVTQNSLVGGNVTTLAGTFFADNNITITNNGGTSTSLNIDATLFGSSFYDGDSQVNVFSGGNLRLAQTLSGIGGTTSDIFVRANGLNVELTGSLLADDQVNYMAQNALTKVYTSALFVGPDVNLNVLNLRGVQDDGSPYTSAAQKPTAQIISNDVNIVAYGSVNSPITGNTNWLTNQMQIEALNTGAPVWLDFSAVGGGFQSINIGVTGDAILTSGLTGTPFSIVGFATPLIFVPPLVANGGSQLIVNASGNMDVNGVIGPGFPLSPVSFQFSGGVALKAGGYLSVNAPLYNAWTLSPAPFQGVFLEAPTIIASSYFAINPGSWVNYSSYPLTGPSQVYSITQPLPTTFQFVNTPNAIHNNTYSRVVTGAPFCTTPNPSPPWAPGC